MRTQKRRTFGFCRFKAERYSSTDTPTSLNLDYNPFLTPVQISIPPDRKSGSAGMPRISEQTTFLPLLILIMHLSIHYKILILETSSKYPLTLSPRFDTLVLKIIRPKHLNYKEAIHS